MTQLPKHNLSHSKLSMSGQSDHGHKILCVIEVLRRNFTVVNFNSKAPHYAKAEIGLVEHLRPRTSKKSGKTRRWRTRSGVSLGSWETIRNCHSRH